jgi:hypothetical protein
LTKKQLTTLLVFVLTISFYIYTLLPSLAWGDGVKLQSEAIAGESFVLAEMSPDEFSPDPFIFSKVGVAAWDHPLYIVLGHILVRTFPFVDSLWLVNLISAIFGAASVALLFVLAYRFSASLLAACYASFSLAVSHTFWWHASTPEVYTLFVFLLLASFYFFDRFESTEKKIFLTYSAFFLGLAASTHVMAFLAIPALGLYFVSRAFGNLKRFLFVCHSEERHLHRTAFAPPQFGGVGAVQVSDEARPEPGRRESPITEQFSQQSRDSSLPRLGPTPSRGGRPAVAQNDIRCVVVGLKKLVMPTLGFLSGLSLYILQFIRMSKNFPLDEIMGPVVGSTFLSQLGTFSPILLGESFLSYLFFLTVQFGPVGLILGTLGMRKAFDRKNVSFRKIVAFFIVFTLFGIFYRVTDQFTFFITSYIFWALLMGIGSDYAFKLVPGKWRLLLPVTLGLVLLATPFFYTALPRLAEENGLNDASIGIPEIGIGVRNGLAYYMNPDKRGDYRAYDFGSQTIANLAHGSLVIAEWYTDTDEYFILRYFTKVEKVRSDVTVVGWPTQDPFSFDSRLALDMIEDAFPEHPIYLASLSDEFYAASKLIEKYCILPENNLYRLYQKGNNALPCLKVDSVSE